MQVSVLFGTFLSAWVAVTSPVLVEMLGLNLLTSGIKWTLFILCCGSIFITKLFAVPSHTQYDLPCVSFRPLTPQAWVLLIATLSWNSRRDQIGNPISRIPVAEISL